MSEIPECYHHYTMEINPNEKPVLAAGWKLLNSGVGFSDIRHSLEAKNYPSAEIDEAIETLRKYHYERRRRRGILSALIGSALLVIGCITAVLIHDNTAGFRVALYAPCIVGSLLVCWGLIDILGW